MKVKSLIMALCMGLVMAGCNNLQKGAGIGAGIYKDHTEAFASLQKLAVVEPCADEVEATAEAYERWKSFV